MHPVFLKIGSFELASYGLMTALGYAAACLYLVPRLKKISLDKDIFWNLIFIAFVGALVGAKLLFVLLNWNQLGTTFAEKITMVVRDFRYGFVFFGGMIVSVGALIYYMKKKNLPILKCCTQLNNYNNLFKQSNTWEWGVTYSSSQLLIISDVK